MTFPQRFQVRYGVLAWFLLLSLLALPFASASQVFNYVQNPQPSDLYDFQGLSTQTISTSAQEKVGHFFLQTQIKDTMCAQSSVNVGSITIIPTMNVKGYQSCLNMSPTVTVRVAVDNPDWGMTPYAQLGDNTRGTDHISVIPYHYNVWQNINQPSIAGETEFDQLVIAQDRNPKLKNWGSMFATGDIGNWVLDEGTFLPYYEWKIDRKSGVCSKEVIDALNDKSTYYSNPSRLFVNGFGTVTASNCNDLMFPGSTSIDRVNGMIDDYPAVLHSLYYDDKFNYQGYPFVIHDIQIKCYNHDKLVGSETLYDTQTNTVTGTTTGGTITTGGLFTFLSSYSRYQLQPYAWSVSQFGQELDSPGNLELLQKDLQFSCPAGTNFYTASVGLRRNMMYRHQSPVDATWSWTDVFDISSGSVLDSTFSLYSQSEDILLSQTGTINLLPPPLNNTILSTTNPDANKINETNSHLLGTGSNNTNSPRPDNTNAGIGPCIDCLQNITTGYGGSGNATPNGGSGITSGGSNIGTGVDDSAVSALMVQSKGQNDIREKSNFMQGLMQVGQMLFLFIIILYALFALFGMLYFFIMLFSIPQKMKETLNMLFHAGIKK